MRRALAFVLMTVAAAGTAAAADDSWPQWLGPTRDGRAAVASLPAPRLTLAWKKPLGGGGSGQERRDAEDGADDPPPRARAGPMVVLHMPRHLKPLVPVAPASRRKPPTPATSATP